mgnify:FL=1
MVKVDGGGIIRLIAGMVPCEYIYVGWYGITVV